MDIQFSEEEQKLADEFDRLCEETDLSKYVSEFNSFENSHRAIVEVKWTRFINQFYLYFETIGKVSSAINYIDRSKWPKHRSTQFLLIVFNLKPLYSSFDRLIKGYYEDCLILLRPVYEAFIKIVYITCFPDDPFATVADEKGIDGKTFNLTNFLKDHLGLDWEEYKFISHLAHSNRILVIKEAIKIKEGGLNEPIELKFEPDDLFFEMGMHLIVFMLYVYLKLQKTLFVTDEIDTVIPNLKSKVEKLIQNREQSIPFYPKPYWPKIFKDTNEIFYMIEKVENDSENWKRALRQIRKSK